MSCVPSLVGGEVIGSVLVETAGAARRRRPARLADGVTQAAPVLASMRNLRLAETRASTDAADRAAQPALRRGNAQAHARQRRAQRLAAARSRCSTSTGSRRSTTSTATRRATNCWPPSATSPPRRPAQATSWRASAARNSSCSCPNTDLDGASWPATSCAPRSAGCTCSAPARARQRASASPCSRTTATMPRGPAARRRPGALRRQVGGTEPRQGAPAARCRGRAGARLNDRAGDGDGRLGCGGRARRGVCSDRQAARRGVGRDRRLFVRPPMAQGTS